MDFKDVILNNEFGIFYKTKIIVNLILHYSSGFPPLFPYKYRVIGAIGNEIKYAT